MAKPPLLARLLLSALRSQGGLRREVRELNRTLKTLVALTRRELGLPTEEQPEVREVPAAADPQVAALAEAWRLEAVLRVTEEFRDAYFRDPTERELLARVEAELGRGERGAAMVAAPSKFDFVEPPPAEGEDDE